MPANRAASPSFYTRTKRASFRHRSRSPTPEHAKQKSDKSSLLSEDLLADLGTSDKEEGEHSNNENEKDDDYDDKEEEEENNSDNEEMNRAKRKRDNDASMLALEAKARGLSNVARVYYSSNFADIMARVEKQDSAQHNKPSSFLQTQPDDVEYRTVLDAINLVPEIEADICILHKYVVQMWSQKLPDLLSLVPNAMEYMRVVSELGDDLQPKRPLNEFLSPALELVVSVALSTAKPPSSSSLESHSDEVDEACKAAFALDSARSRLLAFIEKRMAALAPNLSTLVGAPVAARLLGAAGGLQALCNIPSCNILVLGRGSRNESTSGSGFVPQAAAPGLSSLSSLRHQGFVWDCELVRTAPFVVRRNAARMVSNKVSLCARIDAARSRQDGSYARELRQAITSRIESVLAPTNDPGTKSLPVPDDAPRRRRGGRRARKLRLASAPTQLQRAANRVKFNEPEPEIVAFDTTVGIGTAGAGSNSFHLRNLDVRTKSRTSDKVRQKLKAIGAFTANTSKQLPTSLGPNGTATTVISSASGTATSLAFAHGGQSFELSVPNSSATTSGFATSGVVTWANGSNTVNLKPNSVGLQNGPKDWFSRQIVSKPGSSKYDLSKK